MVTASGFSRSISAGSPSKVSVGEETDGDMTVSIKEEYTPIVATKPVIKFAYRTL
jgi:hypothetical protein